MEQKNQVRKKQQAARKWLIAGTAVVALAVILLVIFSKPSAGEPANFAYDQLPMQGDANAPVKIVEFGDYKCPSCQYFAQQIKPQLIKDYVDKGQVSFYFMNMPIIGPDSYTAALAAQSVYHQNEEAFWKYYEALYNNQGNEQTEWATPDFLALLAKELKLPIDHEKLQQDIAQQTYMDEIQQQSQQADQLHVNGTPALFINGRPFANVFDYDALKAEIENTLKDVKTK
ncbi:DsbA family protein [Brevibacillus fulvus]|uniref:Protein-disulfide isomerase n=1 Tax=Brevibacillus fulvus TaxID=1125967 RepID=A0A939BW36_9BACL|nr:thioredoxin domain-containing protein [Brevibacillus fulvus]MBM7591391.1 protein-disulfide isomerase [Brevibacillus fulvus]